MLSDETTSSRALSPPPRGFGPIGTGFRVASSGGGGGGGVFRASGGGSFHSMTPSPRRKMPPVFVASTPDLTAVVDDVSSRPSLGEPLQTQVGKPASQTPYILDVDDGGVQGTGTGRLIVQNGMTVNVDRDLPPLPPSSPSPPFDSPGTTSSGSSPGKSFEVATPTDQPAMNQKVHHLKATRARSHASSSSDAGSDIPSPGAWSFASGGAEVGMAAEATHGTRKVGDEGSKASGIGKDGTKASPEVDAGAVQSSASRNSIAHDRNAPLASPSAPVATIPPTAKPKPTLTEVVMDALPKRKASDFSVDRTPEAMRLWEASQCRITDELGRSRRFGDFWDDIRFRQDTPTSSIRSRLRRRSSSTSPEEERRESAATADSYLTNSSSGNGATPSATETSGYHTFEGPRSPSLRDLVMDDWVPIERPAEASSIEPEVLRPSTPSAHHANASRSTIRGVLSRTNASIKSSLEKAGGEEWIVMGRKTVVFWIRFFWCPQCQDYSVASLAQLDPVAIHEAGINVIVISNGSWKIIKRYRELFKCPFPIYVDKSRRLYHLMGMTKLTQDFGPLKNRPAYHQSGVPGQLVRALGNAFFKLPMKNPGKRTQLGGEFVLGPGLRCDFAHRMSNVSDHMEAPDVVKIAGCELCTLPERKAVEVAQEELAALERENQELEEWRIERANELDRMRRKKAERRGLRYEAGLRAARNRLSVPTEEGPELDGEDEAVGRTSSAFAVPPWLPLEEGTGIGSLDRLEKQLNNVDIRPKDDALAGEIAPTKRRS